MPRNVLLLLLFACALLGTCHAPLYATIQIQSLTPSVGSPQPLGSDVAWVASATDSNAGPLTFQFNVASPNGAFRVVQDFNIGTQSATAWTSQSFVWTSIAGEGQFRIQVVAKDFTSGETASRTDRFELTSRLSGGGATVTGTANPLVALFSAPSCPAGSLMRATFQKTQGNVKTTDWMACNPPASMNVYIAGMLPGTTYKMNYQVATRSAVTNGPASLSFTTGALPSNVPFPPIKVLVAPGPQTDTTDYVLLHDLNLSPPFFPIATDLQGQIIWYYTGGGGRTVGISEPLTGGDMLGIQQGPAWNPAATEGQVLAEIDLAGNTVWQTNTGVIQQQLLALGATDAGPCSVPNVSVGTSCLSKFHHDVVRLPNGYTAALANIEKIFPPGTQGDTSGLPVDIVGDMVIVMNQNLQVVWYWDAFQHDGGAPQLDIDRPAVLGETCITTSVACLPLLLVRQGVTAPAAHDWLHANSIYYMPSSGDLLVSIRHQDWLVKLDYSNGTGTGNVLWRMGPGGDFAFKNIDNDPFPWFSHQHHATFANNGAGPLTLFDNGNTRLAPPPVGLGSGNSRGMALNVNETARTVTPALSVDLGVYAVALGSAQMLPNGSYFFQPGYFPATQGLYSQSIEILPTPGTTNGTQVFNMQTLASYRSWKLPRL